VPSGSRPSRSWSVSLWRKSCEGQKARRTGAFTLKGPPRCPTTPTPATTNITAEESMHARGSRRDKLPPAQPCLLGKVVIALRFLPQVVVFHALPHRPCAYLWGGAGILSAPWTVMGYMDGLSTHPLIQLEPPVPRITCSPILLILLLTAGLRHHFLPQDPIVGPSCLARNPSFFLPPIIISLLCWECIVTYTKVLTIYRS
jgi:hypothetical protein